jgi:hypothetical protein
MLEDFVALPVGSSVVVLVSSSDPFFELSWQPLLQAVYTLSPTHCYKFGSSFYYSVELVVSTNSHCEAFCNSLVLEETTKYLCTDTGGGALTLTPVYSSSKRDCGLQIKYHTVFHGSELLTIAQDDEHQTTWCHIPSLRSRDVRGQPPSTLPCDVL